jgi:protein SCO1/2
MTKPPKLTPMLIMGLIMTSILIALVVLLLMKRTDQSEFPVIGQLSKFELMDENGVKISNEDLKGKVWLADVIFTRCPGPCAKMTHHLAEIQKELKSLESVRLVTLTSDPEYDTAEVLNRYAKRFGADTNQWMFLTGAKAEIRRLEVSDFKFVVVEKNTAQRDVPEDLFIHSTWYVVVDRDGKVRGWKDAAGGIHAYYDSEDAGDRQRVVENIRRLLN